MLGVLERQKNDRDVVNVCFDRYMVQCGAPKRRRLGRNEIKENSRKRRMKRKRTEDKKNKEVH